MNEEAKKEQEAPKQEEPKQEAPQAEEQKPKQGEPTTKKKKKINCLSPKELDKRIEEVKQKMGGLCSRYARQLLNQKERLLGQGKPNPKAGE